MKRLLFSALALLSTAAIAATTNPVSLLNPAGSTAGQAVLSTGPSSPPAWGAVPLTGITGTLAIANGGTGATSASAARTALGLGTSSTLNTGTSGATVPLLNGANTWSGAQGFTAAITPSQTAGIVGTTTNNSANAGSVGEYATTNTSATPLTTGTAANCASMSLSAGDWDVQAAIGFTPTGTTAISRLQTSVSTVSATIGALGTTGSQTFINTGTVTNTYMQVPSPVVRVSLASTSTVYAVGRGDFSASTLTCDGFIRARRIR